MLDISDGIGPERLFWLMSRNVRWKQLPISGGTGPEKEFLLRSSFST
jgi:hypothetical protein